MAYAEKLKDSLDTNVPKVLTMHKRGKEYDNKFKPGEKQYHYIFRDGTKEYSHYANTREQETLQAYNPGGQITVVRSEMVIEEGGQSKRVYFLKWGEGDSAEMKAEPQLKTNTAIKTAEKKQDEFDRAKDVHDWKLGLAGIVQAMIISGREDMDITGEEMLMGKNLTAPQWARWIRQKAEKLSSEL